MREEVPPASVRHGGAPCVRVQASGAVQGRGEAVLPQGGEGGVGGSV